MTMIIMYRRRLYFLRLDRVQDGHRLFDEITSQVQREQHIMTTRIEVDRQIEGTIEGMTQHTMVAEDIQGEEEDITTITTHITTKTQEVGMVEVGVEDSMFE